MIIQILILCLLSVSVFAQDPINKSGELRVSYLSVTGGADDVLKDGFDMAFWYSGPAINKLNNQVHQKLESKFARKIKLTTGLFFNRFTGDQLQRKYQSFGVTPGLKYESRLGSSDLNEFFSQFDFRLAWVHASRNGASTSNFALQPVLAIGYLRKAEKWKVGTSLQYLISTDNDPLTAYGIGIHGMRMF